jgi:hypothetical protein
MKALFRFFVRWHDLIILAPSALILFIIGENFIHAIDPTASTLELGVLSVLNWNLFLLLLIGSASYYLYSLWFGDYFSNGWEYKLSPFQGAVLSFLLWITTLCVSCFVLLRNL